MRVFEDGDDSMEASYPSIQHCQRHDQFEVPSPVSCREFRSSCHVAQFGIVPEALPSTFHSCSAESGFSCLRRMKTYLRSTMGADRLNACALYNIHNDILDEFDIDAITDEWIGRSKARMERFVLSRDSLRKY